MDRCLDMTFSLQYAVISFRPYPEVGEFLNVGVVAVESGSRHFAYQLLPGQRTKRIRACFPELDLAIYRSGLRRIEGEFAALAIETNTWSDDQRASAGNHPAQLDLFSREEAPGLFRELTLPGGGTFFFSSRGARFAEDVDAALGELYRRHVEHWELAPSNYEEQKLVRDLRRLLREEKLDRCYREVARVGSESYHVGIPLVWTPPQEDVPAKAIKPLNLGRSTPTQIYMHGDDWIARIKRLRLMGKLPEQFLFAVKMPLNPDCRPAAEEICESLRRSGVHVADFEDEQAILEFARVDEEELVLIE